MAKQKVYVYDEEKTIRRRTIAMEVEKDFFQVYRNLLDYMVGIKSLWTVKYLVYLASKMNNENLVDVGANSAREFSNYIKEKGLEPPSERTIREAITELTELRLLIKLDRGKYRLNSALFWQADLKNRMEQVGNLVTGGHELGPKIFVVESKEEEILKINGEEVKNDSNQRVFEEGSPREADS